MMQTRVAYRRVWLFVAACAMALVPWSPALGDDAVTKRLDEAVLRAGLGQFWGGVLVMQDGEVLLAKGYGLANESLEPITAQHVFDFGSVSKMFTAAAILKLEEQGRLSTNDPLTKYFPGAKKAAVPAGEPGTTATEITIDHLLTHTSGKSDEHGAIQPLNFEDRDEAVRLFMASKQVTSPGSAFAYCNGGYVVLAAIIEKVTEKPFEQVMRELVLGPAEMDHSGFLDGAGVDASKQTRRLTAPRGPVPWGQSRVRQALLLDKTVEPWAWGLRGAGGLCTTLDDLAVWSRAIESNAVLGEQATTKWLTPSSVGSGYARGWQIESTRAGRVRYAHGGSTRGYMCHVARYPATDGGGSAFIAVLTNETMGRVLQPHVIGEALERVLWPQDKATSSATIDFSKETLGEYSSATLENGAGSIVTREANDAIAIAMGPLAEGKDGVLERTPVRATLNQAAARQLATAIRQTLDGGSGTGLMRTGSHVPTPDGGTKLLIAGYGYRDRLQGGTKVFEVAAAEWQVLASYRGRGSDGKEIRDPRLVIVMTDDALPGMWPVMLHMDDPAAARLAESLTEAAK